MVQNKIWPAVIAKNQSELNLMLKKLKGASKTLHLDVMDNEFVLNSSLNFPLKLSKNYDYVAHLMINNPKRFIEKYLKKIGLFLSHFEKIKDPEKFISWLKSKNLLVGFAIKPETKVSALKPYLKDVNYILILTVHPGFYGSKFLKSPLKKIDRIKKINSKIKVVVDGGMNPDRAPLAFKAGADFIVSGSYVTKSLNPKKSVSNLLKAFS